MVRPTLNNCLPFLKFNTTHVIWSFHSQAFTPEKQKHVPTKICTWIFMEAFFITAQNEKQLKCSSAAEWINKIWHCHMMEYYSVIKSNGLQIYLVWMNLKLIKPSQSSLRLCMISFIKKLESICGERKQIGGSCGCGKRRYEQRSLQGILGGGGDGNILYLDWWWLWSM